MKTALAQMNIRFEDKQANISEVERYITEASQNDVNIIFFPEMTLTGFSMNVSKTWEENNETINIFKKLSKKYCIAVGFGWVNKTGEKGENHYTVVSPEEIILADYVKIHPFSYSGEDKYFNAGNSLSSFTYMERKISIFICYDLRFPEIFQAASKESDVIVIAANWPEKRSSHWKILLEARAVENQSWILGVNCFGRQQETSYSGNSRIIMPDGTVYAEINEKEGLIYSSIDNESEMIRNNFSVKKDRKPELYRTLI